MVRPRITSYGDLEVVLLHEAHEALADIIGPYLYRILGEPPNQEIRFENEHLFDLFLIRLVELFVEGRNVGPIEGRRRQWRLIEGLGWFCERYGDEAGESGLGEAVRQLTEWTNVEAPFSFWCADIEAEVEFPLSRRDLVWFGANRAKHNVLRLSSVLDKLDRKLKKVGIDVSPEDVIAVLEAANEEVRNRLIYHSTYIVELLGNVFIGLNRVICGRFGANPTNRVNEMHMPDGVTSDLFRNLYGAVLVFKRYDEAKRIQPYVPATSEYYRRGR